MLGLHLYIVLLLLCEVEGEVDNTRLENASVLHFSKETHPTIIVQCHYDFILTEVPRLYEVNSKGNLDVKKKSRNGDLYLEYTVHTENNGYRTYVCEEPALKAISVILCYDRTTPPCNNTTTPPNKPKFPGLNPLIYTISAVILLGTLAIVAIVTCWIRARRSFNNRVLRANNAPQDYFDYISDNEFTPLTTSEFVASLQERPPTYIESEQIEQDVRTDDETNNTGSNNTPNQASGTAPTLSLRPNQETVQSEHPDSVVTRTHNPTNVTATSTSTDQQINNGELNDRDLPSSSEFQTVIPSSNEPPIAALIDIEADVESGNPQTETHYSSTYPMLIPVLVQEQDILTSNLDIEVSVGPMNFQKTGGNE